MTERDYAEKQAKSFAFWMAMAITVILGITIFGIYDADRVQDRIAKQNEQTRTDLANEGNVGKVIGFYYEYTGKGHVRHTLAVVELKSKKRVGIEVIDKLPVIDENWEISFDTAYHFVKPMPRAEIQ